MVARWYSLRRSRRLVLALATYLALVGLLEVWSSARAAQGGSQTTINLCATKAGPDKGDIRFVQSKTQCKVGELHFQVGGSSDRQGMFGARGSAAEVATPSPADGVTGYLRVESTSAIASGSGGDPETATTTVACPEARKVVGGGYQVNAGPVTAGNNPAEVTVTQNQATSDAAWTVAAVTRDKDEVGSWTVSAYAICAEVGA